MINLVQDIHLSDVDLWGYFKKYWDDKNYVAALNLLNNNQQLLSKYLSADWLNALTSLVYELENNSDPEFKSDKIELSYIPPALESGGVYFQLNDTNVRIGVGIDFIQTGTNSVSIPYQDTLINFMSFDDLALCKTDVTLGSSSVTFSTNANVSNPITCLVFYGASEQVMVETGQIGTSQTEVEIECDSMPSGYILSAYAVDTSTNKVITCNQIARYYPFCFFELAEPPSASVNCFVVYTEEALTDSDTKTITTSNVQTILDCFGYLVNLFCDVGGADCWTDAVLQNNTVVITLPEAPPLTTHCTSLYT